MSLAARIASHLRALQAPGRAWRELYALGDGAVFFWVRGLLEVPGSERDAQASLVASAYPFGPDRLTDEMAAELAKSRELIATNWPEIKEIIDQAIGSKASLAVLLPLGELQSSWPERADLGSTLVDIAAVGSSSLWAEVRSLCEDALTTGDVGERDARQLLQTMSTEGVLFRGDSSSPSDLAGFPLLAHLAVALGDTAYVLDDYVDVFGYFDAVDGAISILRAHVEARSAGGSAVGDLYDWLYVASSGSQPWARERRIRPVCQALGLVADLAAAGELSQEEGGLSLAQVLAYACTETQLRGLTYELRRWARTGERSEVLELLRGRPGAA